MARPLILSLELRAFVDGEGLLYAGRVNLVSLGSSLRLRRLNGANSASNRQLDFPERHFRENISRDAPEKADEALEMIRQYRPLRRGWNLTNFGGCLGSL